jgi:hypothetical protein
MRENYEMNIADHQLEIQRVLDLLPPEIEYRLHISDDLDEARHEMYRYNQQFD